CATRDSGTLRTAVKVKNVSSSGGMIIQDYEFSTSDRHGLLYEATTTFGFFTAQALAQQVGVRDAKPYQRGPGESFDYPAGPPFPARAGAKEGRRGWLRRGGRPGDLGFHGGVKKGGAGGVFLRAPFRGRSGRAGVAGAGGAVAVFEGDPPPPLAGVRVRG